MTFTKYSLVKNFSVIAVFTLASTGVASAQTVQDPNTAASAAPTVNTTGTNLTAITLRIEDNVFDPHNIVIRPGTTVTWVNTGLVPHTVTADNGSFNSGPIAPGASYSRQFNTPGAFVFYSQGHGTPGGLGMFGTLVVLSPGVNLPLTGSVPAVSTAVPTLPNTGEGGTAAMTIMALLFSGLIVAAGMLSMRRQGPSLFQ